ncbi:MAG: phosphatidylcholine/phosphatidylserine synthase [Rhodospirillaceae bacterium]
MSDPLQDPVPLVEDTERPAQGRFKVRGRAARKLSSLSFNRIVPNMLTLVALCAGLTAIRYGFAGLWDRAVVAILIAAMLDGVDGRIARLLKGTSKFGAELDSLADAINFGVAPALVMFLWAMHDAGGIGWAVCLLHAICTVLRLARFNTMVGQDLPHWAHNYFTGVPSPGGAGIAILPLIFWLLTEERIFQHWAVAGIFLIASAVLMVSRVPVYSGKHVRLKPQLVVPLMVLVAVIAALLVTEPWATLSFIGLVYIALIPMSVWSYKRLERGEAAKGGHPTANVA